MKKLNIKLSMAMLGISLVSTSALADGTIEVEKATNLKPSWQKALREAAPRKDVSKSVKSVNDLKFTEDSDDESDVVQARVVAQKVKETNYDKVKATKSKTDSGLATRFWNSSVGVIVKTAIVLIKGYMIKFFN